MTRLVRRGAGEATTCLRVGSSGNRCLTFSDPFGLCEKPRGSGIGICIEAFIRAAHTGPFGILPGNNRESQSDGGGYKASFRFSINPATGAVSGEEKGPGTTWGFSGYGGFVGSKDPDGNGGWIVKIEGIGIASAFSDPDRRMAIDFDFVLHVTKEGDVLMESGSHDGFPSYEIWIYYPDAEPERLYYWPESSYWLLAPPKEVKVPPSPRE